MKLIKRIIPNILYNRMKKSNKIQKFYLFYTEVLGVFSRVYSNRDGSSSATPLLKNFEASFNGNNFSMVSIIHKPLKWAYGTLDFRSIYSGSSDRILFNQLLSSNILHKITSENECILVSVIGGGFFIDLIKTYSFSNVVLFDSNINEHAKVSSLINRIHKGEFIIGQFEEDILEDSKSLVPFLKDSDLSFSVAENCILKYSSEELEGKQIKPIVEIGFPMVELENNFPRRALHLDRYDKLIVIDKLKNSLDKKIYVTVPQVDANGKVVIYFLSNISNSDINNNKVLRNTINSAGTFIIRVDNEISNLNLNDAHQHWRMAIYHELKDKKVVHLVATKKHEKDHTHDPLYLLTTYIKDINLDFIKFNTIFLHILLGHASSINRIHKYLFNLLSDLPLNISEIVVTEHSLRYFKRSRFNRNWVSDDDIVDYYNSLFQSFSLKKKQYIYGQNDSQRNILLVYSRG